MGDTSDGVNPPRDGRGRQLSASETTTRFSFGNRPPLTCIRAIGVSLVPSFHSNVRTLPGAWVALRVFFALIGSMSYTIYFILGPVHVAISPFTVRWTHWTTELVRLAIILPLAAASWYLMEQPLAGWRLRTRAPRTSADPGLPTGDQNAGRTDVPPRRALADRATPAT
jgi:peptidoglycan/LPS O-acetylase OafA/YrhL